MPVRKLLARLMCEISDVSEAKALMVSLIEMVWAASIERPSGPVLVLAHAGPKAFELNLIERGGQADRNVPAADQHVGQDVSIAPMQSQQRFFEGGIDDRTETLR